jgi:hypothetical protein
MSYCLVSAGIAVSTSTYKDISPLRSVIDDGVRAVLQGCPLLRETDVEYASDIIDRLRVKLVKRREMVEHRVCPCGRA